MLSYHSNRILRLIYYQQQSLFPTISVSQKPNIARSFLVCPHLLCPMEPLNSSLTAQLHTCGQIPPSISARVPLQWLKATAAATSVLETLALWSSQTILTHLLGFVLVPLVMILETSLMSTTTASFSQSSQMSLLSIYIEDRGEAPWASLYNM